MYTYALKETHWIGWETGGAFAFFLICLLVLVYYRKKETAVYGFFFPFVPAAMLVVYCPLFADRVRSAFDSGAVYIRLHWLFFMIPLSAAALAVLIGSGQWKTWRLIPLLLLLLLLHPHDWDYFLPAENAYKIPDAAIEVSDLILEDCGETPVRVMIQWHENASPYFNDDTSVSSEFYYGIRMYASNLILSFCTVTEEMWNAEGFDLAAYIPPNYDYVVCRDEQVLKDGCAALGYELMDAADGYAVFRHT